MSNSSMNNGYTISRCEKEDVDDVRVFFNDFWAKDHIFYLDGALFDWMYYNRRCDSYNMLIARDNESGDIAGQVGFIPNFMFDDDIVDKDKFIWFSTWMVRPDVRQQGGLGIKLLTSVLALENTKNVGVSGIFDSAVPLYKMMKFETGILEHYFIMNEGIRDFKIAGVPPGHPGPMHGKEAKSEIAVIDQNGFEGMFFEVAAKNRVDFPKKTKTYYIKRYYQHPIYKYEAMSVKTGGITQAVFIFRTVRHDGACILRIVDGFGDFDKIDNMYDPMQQLLSVREAEYIDIYCKGIGADIMEKAGFSRHFLEDSLIIPNFFEPFEQTNRNINYAYYNGMKRDYVIFKGDGDQDRPNILHPR